MVLESFMGYAMVGKYASLSIVKGNSFLRKCENIVSFSINIDISLWK